ncbi:MAG TPA: hypothetical protein VGU23_02855 [Acidobacteriaceae bacterium]|nr:hypothetical protein [Acidobacteriaceae bacterium]
MKADPVLDERIGLYATIENFSCRNKDFEGAQQGHYRSWNNWILCMMALIGEPHQKPLSGGLWMATEKRIGLNHPTSRRLLRSGTQTVNALHFLNTRVIGARV